MDKRGDAEIHTYQQELAKEKADTKSYDEYVEENGKRFYVPYHTVREVIFSGVSKEDLRDTEHAARLQYRLMLKDSILFAKVEFVARRIKITFNPEGADNRKEKMSLQQLIEFLAKEGVNVDQKQMQQRDVDYYNEIYKYQYNPPSIREHPPYGYTLEEWRNGMKAEYETHKQQYDKAKLDKFHTFQKSYVLEHPELAEELGIDINAIKEEEEKKVSLIDKVLKKDKAKKKDEKGFWFHGV
ncbi:MAG: hypothetical protein KGI04_01195 [Candidatus Micrarchaeota archaeon]|nr:hypothetical protein [Candidatus Micrarchaeota archaeon]